MRSLYSLFLLAIAHVYALDTGLPNLSDRPQAQDRNIDIFADALYWYTSESIDWAFTTTPSETHDKSSYKTVAFDWNPGFRVGLGYNIPYDQWDTQLTYTQFQTDVSHHGSGRITSAFLAARLSLLEPFQTGKANFNIHYNVIDWDLGRSFSISQFLSIRPYIGAKGGWINQKINLKWTIPDLLGIHYSATERVKNNFEGIGPKGGVNGKWILGNLNKHVFSLLSNFSGAFMWGHWELQDKFTDIFLTQTSIPMANRNFGALMLQAMMGLGWDLDFNQDSSHIAIKLGYEIQDWFNHFQVFTNASGTQNSDLIFQGLTADLRFDF